MLKLREKLTQINSWINKTFENEPGIRVNVWRTFQDKLWFNICNGLSEDEIINILDQEIEKVNKTWKINI